MIEAVFASGLLLLFLVATGFLVCHQAGDDRRRMETKLSVHSHKRRIVLEAQRSNGIGNDAFAMTPDAADELADQLRAHAEVARSKLGQKEVVGKLVAVTEL